MSWEKRWLGIASKIEMSLVAEEENRCFVLIAHCQSHYNFQAVMLLQPYLVWFFFPTFNADDVLIALFSGQVQPDLSL